MRLVVSSKQVLRSESVSNGCEFLVVEKEDIYYKRALAKEELKVEGDIYLNSEKAKIVNY